MARWTGLAWCLPLLMLPAGCVIGDVDDDDDWTDWTDTDTDVTDATDTTDPETDVTDPTTDDTDPGTDTEITDDTDTDVEPDAGPSADDAGTVEPPDDASTELDAGNAMTPDAGGTDDPCERACAAGGAACSDTSTCEEDMCFIREIAPDCEAEADAYLDCIGDAPPEAFACIDDKPAYEVTDCDEPYFVEWLECSNP